MSDTPETDGEWNRIACYEHPQFEQSIADFARKMERERNEWKEVAEGNLLGAIHERDEAQERVSQNINQVGKMLLRIEEMKREHKNECRKIREGFLNVIGDLHETVFNLRTELHDTQRVSRIWKKAHSEIVENRDMWMSEAEKWRDVVDDYRD